MKFKRTVKVDMEKLAVAVKSGNAIPTSGVYDITLKAVTLDLAPWGDQQLGMLVEVDGTQKMLYSVLNLGAESLDGQEKWRVEQAEKAWALFDHLCVVSGIDPESIADTETLALPIGKAGADVDCEVITEFTDIDIKAWIKQEYYVSKQGDIGEKLVLKEVFTATGLSGDEVIREETEPVRLSKIEKYTTAIKYGNDLTEEAVKDWIDAERPKGTGAAAGTPSAAKKAPSFAKKTPSFAKK